MDTEKYVRETLFTLCDNEYKEFHKNLIPNIDPNNIIGVRTNVLRQFADEFAKTPESYEFMEHLPHKYYDENNLHGFIIEHIENFDCAIYYLQKFLPFVDNWATCDLMNPKILGTEPSKLLDNIKIWIESNNTYEIRFGILSLMRYFLTNNFQKKYLTLVSKIKSDEYYVNMMVAWYFATALALQWDSAIVFIEKQKLPPFVHNKAIQKAIESRRIEKEQKDYLKTLKIKRKYK